jgi:hypothetical protein
VHLLNELLRNEGVGGGCGNHGQWSKALAAGPPACCDGRLHRLPWRPRCLPAAVSTALGILTRPPACLDVCHVCIPA